MGLLSFLSTLSLRRATNNLFTSVVNSADFYPRSPCGERRVTVLGIQHRTGISIHALLAESDPPRVIRKPTAARFLSTLSLRRATRIHRQFPRQSPISIHALLAESDVVDTVKFAGSMLFLSTLSLRRATLRVVDGSKSSIISIHALLAESDNKVSRFRQRKVVFLSTLSLRRATVEFHLFASSGVFLSTLSLRRATQWRRSVKLFRQFLSTLSLRRATGTKKFKMPVPAYFYPRSPCGERQRETKTNEDRYKFLSTLSLRRATTHHFPALHDIFISIHALLAESDDAINPS